MTKKSKTTDATDAADDESAETRGSRWAWLSAESLVGVLAGIIAGTVTSVLLLLFTPGLQESFVTQPSCDDPRDLQLVTPTGVEASSALAFDAAAQDPTRGHPAADAIDSNAGTAWVEGADGYGIGESIVFTLPASTDLRMICIVNGYAKTVTLYNLNSRPRQLGIDTAAGKATAVLGGGTDATFQRFQKVRFAEGKTDAVTLTIRSTWVGAGNDAAPDTSISEVEFWAKE